MKLDKILAVGAIALGAYWLFSKQSTDYGGGGGATGGLPTGFYPSYVQNPSPDQTGGGQWYNFGQQPQNAGPTAAAQYQQSLNQQLLAAGATPAAVKNMFGGYAGSAYYVSPQGGIIKNLAQFQGFEAVSPTGRAYSTQNAPSAYSISIGGTPNWVSSPATTKSTFARSFMPWWTK